MQQDLNSPEERQGLSRRCTNKTWWARQDLNLRPMDYESTALTAELQAPAYNLSFFKLSAHTEARLCAPSRGCMIALPREVYRSFRSAPQAQAELSYARTSA